MLDIRIEFMCSLYVYLLVYENTYMEITFIA